MDKGKMLTGTNGKLTKRDFPSQNDRALSDGIHALHDSQKELGHLNVLIRDALGVKSSWQKSFAARIIHSLVPKKLHEHLPDRVMKFVAEEYDVLELIESKQKSNINNTQEALRQIAVSAGEKLADLNDLRATIAKAKEENWDAQRLQQEMADRAGIEVFDEVANLLDREFELLNPAVKEARKSELLNQLDDQIKLGEGLIEAMQKVCGAGLQVFHRGVAQYAAYLKVYKPIAAIRDSAQAMIDMDTSMYAARDALQVTFASSIKAVEAALDAAQLVDKYSVTGPEMQTLLIAGKNRLEQKILAIELQAQKAHVQIEHEAKEKPVAADVPVEAEVVTLDPRVEKTQE